MNNPIPSDQKKFDLRAYTQCIVGVIILFMALMVLVPPVGIVILGIIFALVVSISSILLAAMAIFMMLSILFMPFRKYAQSKGINSAGDMFKYLTTKGIAWIGVILGILFFAIGFAWWH